MANAVAPAVAAALDVLEALPPSTSRKARLCCTARCLCAAALDATLFLISRALRGEQMSPFFSFVDNPLPSLPQLLLRCLCRHALTSSYTSSEVLPVRAKKPSMRSSNRRQYMRCISPCACENSVAIDTSEAALPR